MQVQFNGKYEVAKMEGWQKYLSVVSDATVVGQAETYQTAIQQYVSHSLPNPMKVLFQGLGLALAVNPDIAAFLPTQTSVAAVPPTPSSLARSPFPFSPLVSLLPRNGFGERGVYSTAFLGYAEAKRFALGCLTRRSERWCGMSGHSEVMFHSSGSYPF